MLIELSIAARFGSTKIGAAQRMQVSWTTQNRADVEESDANVERCTPSP